VIAPNVALVVAGILLVLGIVLLYLLWSRVRRGYLRFRTWRERRAAAA
jgi:hypothetical protein